MPDEVMNIGRGHPVALGEFIAQLEAVAGGPATVVPTPRPATEILRTWADNTKACRLLGFDPRVDVAEGVSRMWDWFASTAR